VSSSGTSQQLGEEMKKWVPGTLGAGEPHHLGARGLANKLPGQEEAAINAASDHQFEAMVALLQSDPAVCRRLAATVDLQTAEEWASARADVESAIAQACLTAPMPTRRQFWALHLRSAIPFIGFGFFDNMIMLTVGGAIESTIGVACGLSSLAAAGMGQMVSDASGITLQGLIERFSDKIGLPDPALTLEQMQLAKVKSFMLGSRIFGIVFGCALGMFPLVLMPEKQVSLVDQIAGNLPPQRRVEFMSLVQTRQFQEGETILAFGEMSDFVFLVESGQVECQGRDAEGLPFHVCTMGPGNSFGKPQLHCASHVNLIAKDGPVIVQSIEKDDFLRVTGQEGMEVWESTQQVEHTVYFASQGNRLVDAVPPPKRGTGKTRMFAALSDADKIEVLNLSGVEGFERFCGKQGEGKVSFFASLTEEQKYGALQKFQAKKYSKYTAGAESE